MKHYLSTKGFMMTLQNAFLPIDTTGNASNNLLQNELHQTEGGTKSAIRPNAGSYYKTTLQVYSVDGLGNLSPLVLGTDYLPADLNQDATMITGQEVCELIILINPDLPSLFSITYQAYGGLNNINTTALYNAYLAAALGTPTPIADIAGVPVVFQPAPHIHDVADIYGMENAVGFLTDLKNAVTISPSVAKYQVVTSAIASFSTSLASYNNALLLGMREHIDTVAYPHPYTATQVGLGNVSNYGFLPIVAGGVTLPHFASPATVVASLSPLPTYRSSTHATLTDNPHNDSVLTIPGLANVVDLGSVINYAVGTNAYVNLFSSNATQVYIGPSPAINGVKEETAAVYSAQYATATTSYFTPIETTLASATTVIAEAAAVNSSTNLTLTNITTNLATINTALAQTTLLDFTFSLINNNSAYAAVLEQLLAIEYSSFTTKTGITADGYYPLPEKLSNLVCWLSANNPDNGLFLDPIGYVRVIKLVDKAVKRSFTALPNLAPILRPSNDKTGSVPGITNGNVLSFNNGLNLTLSEGEPIYITPGMTIIAVVKSGPPNTSLQLLGNPSLPEIVGLFANTTTNQSIDIITSSGWVPMSAPAASQPSNQSTILISTISPIEEAQSWFASCNEFNAVLYPRGVSTPVTTWPSAGYIGDPLTQIGNPNFAVPNVGEVAELLIYDRQLSAAEVKAVVAYLQLRYSLSTALSVDFAALSAF